MIDVYRNIRSTVLWPLIEASKRYYIFNHAVCEYHNHAHAFNVVVGVNTLTNNRPSIPLVLAAEWHDAVYVPGAGSDANERCSAAALGLEARRLDASVGLNQEFKNDINAAQELIEYTSIEYHLHRNRLDGDIAILLDADLLSLSQPYEGFVVQQDRIIRENGGSVERDRKRSAEFLVNFLNCREFIYHTDMARKMNEAQARSNIEMWCSNNGVQSGV